MDTFIMHNKLNLFVKTKINPQDSLTRLRIWYSWHPELDLALYVAKL